MQADLDQGIKVTPTPIIAGQRVDIQYEGLLAKSGAQDLYCHTGFGLNDGWENITDVKMNRLGNCFATKIAVDKDSRLNFCFHDNAGNWDNNSGRNWSFEIHNGKLY
ncbi:MAG: carbohydrate-binding protein [Halanaerobiales bacterium]|nr:carbohydrate-binding protein [Halanaerobiales bacterium]